MSPDGKPDVKEIKAFLESFLDIFNKYSAEIFGDRERNKLDDMRRQLQRLEPRITSYLIQINGDGVVVLGSFGVRQQIAHRDLIITALLGGNNELAHNFADYDDCVTSYINRALGRIDSGLWPSTEPPPILVVNDKELKDRCSDLLESPGKFDRVVREATLILEDRLRKRVSHERLTALIPESAKQTADNLVNSLLSPTSPVLSISTDQKERAAFHKIMLGVFSYLRNPFHHQINDTIDWSWSWSIVGFIDHLLNEIEKCEEIQ